MAPRAISSYVPAATCWWTRRAFPRRPSRLGRGRRYAHRLSRLLLVLVARANSLDGKALAVSFRVGAARTRPAVSRPLRRGDAEGITCLHRVDARAIT